MPVKTGKNWLNRFLRMKRILKKSLQQIAAIFKPEFTPITSGTFDLHELVTLLGKDDPVILEIGANDGSHTALFLELFPKAKIYAFEPDPRASEKFQRRLGNDSRVVLEKIAISAIDGEIDFFMSNSIASEDIPGNWDQSGSIRKPKEHLEYSTKRSGCLRKDWTLGGRRRVWGRLILFGQMFRGQKLISFKVVSRLWPKLAISIPNTPTPSYTRDRFLCETF